MDRWPACGLLVKPGDGTSPPQPLQVMEKAPALSVVVPWDGGQLLAGIAGEGLFTVYPRKNELKPLPEPVPGAFKYVE